MKRERPIIWSSGGGTQSAAIAVLISQGRLPTPERCVIADTGRESSETWEYNDRVIRPLLAKVGLEVEIAPHSLATVDLYDREGLTLIPAWTNTGQKSSFCSNEWKKRVVRRYLTDPERGYGPRNPIIEWVGFSKNEISRCKPSDAKWVETRWPLIYGYGVTVTRADCVRIVEEAGLPSPPRSSCWLCPYRTNKEWRRMRDTQPEDFRRAILADREIRGKDPTGEGLYLHSSRVPLEMADLDDEPELTLFSSDEMVCTSGAGCWT